MPATITWLGKANTDWTAAANWDLNRAPANGDDVIIPDVAGTAFVQVNLGTSTNVALNSLDADEELRIQTGTITLSGGTTTFDKTVKLLPVGNNSGRLALAGTAVANFTGAVQIDAGLLDAGATGAVNFASPVTWTGGFISGAKVMNTAGNTVTLSGTSSPNLRGTLTNQGTINVTGTGNLFIDTAGHLVNAAGGVIDFKNTGGLSRSTATGSVAKVTNAGTIRKTTGTGTANLRAPVTTTTPIEVTAGTLAVADRLTLEAGGGLSIAAGATITLSSEILANVSATISGAGTFASVAVGTSTNGAFTLAAGKTLTFDLPNGAKFQSGVIQGAGTVVNKAVAEFGQKGAFSGVIVRNGVTFVNPAGSELRVFGNGNTFTNSTLHNDGTIVHEESGLSFDATSQFVNSATAVYDFRNTARINGKLVNEGTIRTSNTSTTNFQAATTHRGLLEHTGGKLRLSGDFRSQSGRISVAAGSIVIVGTGANTPTKVDWVGNTRVFGDGTFQVDVGEINPTAGSTVTLDLPVGGLLMNSNSGLNGGGQFVVNGPWKWSGGLIGATGGVTANGPVTIVGGASLFGVQEGGVLNIANTATITGGTLPISNGTLNVLPGGTFDIAGDFSVSASSRTGAPAISNRGLFRKVGGGTGSSSVSGPVENFGTIEAKVGTLNFTTSVTQQAGTILLSGGKLGVTGKGLNLLGGELSGSGTITGTVVNTAGLVSPGNSPGALTIAGDYTQLVGGTLKLELGGKAAGQFDTFTANKLILDGILDLDVLPGYTPAIGDTFPAVTATNTTGTPVTGGFVTVDGQIISATDAFAITQAAKAITLTVAKGVNLKTVEVTVPSKAEPGTNVTIGYKVRNTFNATTAGKWTDSIYLSKDNLLDATDLLIGRTTHTGDLTEGQEYTGSLTAQLPPALPGNYRVLVQTDSGNILPDINPFDDIGFSTSLVNVDVPVLRLDQPVTGTIKTGEMKFFRLDIDAGRDAVVTLDEPTAGTAELIVRYLQMPTRTAFDQRSFTATAKKEQIVWSSPQSGDYFILLVGGAAATTNGRSFTLSARQAAFELFSITQGTTGNVSPGVVIGSSGPGTAAGSNLGSSTVTLTGAGLTPNTTVKLVGNGTETTATAVRYQGQNRLLVTFDLRSLPVGTYNVVASNENGSTTLNGAFTVNALAAGTLSFTLSAPASIREDNEGQVTLTYRNTGNTDVAAPLLLLSGTNAQFKLPGDPVFGGSLLQLLAINTAGLPSVLPAGFVGTITVDFQNISGQVAQNSTFQVQQLNPQSTINFADLKDGLRPPFVASEAWDIIYANFLREVGTTVGSYATVLRDNADRLAQLGDYVFDADALTSFEIAQAGDFGAIADRFKSGLYGLGVDDPYTERLQQLGNGAIAIVNTSEVRLFSPVLNGFIAIPGDTGQLRQKSDGNFMIEESTGMQRHYRADGLLEFIQDIEGNRISYQYDLNNRLVEVRDANDRRMRFEQDASGRVVRRTDGLGGVATFNYDGSGRLSSVTDITGTSKYTYITTGAARGAIESVSIAGGIPTQFQYDTFGRLTTTQVAGNTGTVIEYDTAGGYALAAANGDRLRQLRNANGQIARIFDATGRIFTIRYDANGQPIKFNLPGNLAITTQINPTGQSSSFTDTLGNVVQITNDPISDRVASIRDPLGRVTQFEYDSKRNEIATIFPDGTREESEYDANSKIVMSINRAGFIVRYEYNINGQVTRRIFANGQEDTFTYDNDFNLTSVTDVTGTTTFEYVNDRLARMTMPTGRTIQLEYTPDGKRSRQIDGDGNVINYIYDSLNRLSQLTDGAGNVLERNGYDQLSRLTRVDYANGTAVQRTYDSVGRLTAVVHTAANGTETARYTYEYNLSDFLTRKTTPEGEYRYVHDAIGRLIQSTLPNGTVTTYEYDANGNRTVVTVNGVQTLYTGNILDQYTSRGSDQYEYDTNGNLTAIISPTGTTRFSYTDLNQLSRIVTPSGSTIEYLYNGIGVRVAEIVDGARTDFLFDPIASARVLSEYQNGSFSARYVHGAFGLSSRTDASGQQVFYAADGNENITRLTSSTGDLLNEYQYDPFGKILEQNEGVRNRFTFAGAVGVEETAGGVYFMRSRFYDTETGRFTQPDPIGFTGEQTNLYNYVGNNPVQLTDPSGLLGTAGAGAIAGGVTSLLSLLVSKARGDGIETIKASEIAQAFVGGSIGGFFAGSGFGSALGASFAEAAGGEAARILTGLIAGEFSINEIDVKGSALDVALNSAVNTLFNKIGGSKEEKDKLKTTLKTFLRQGFKGIAIALKDFIKKGAKLVFDFVVDEIIGNVIELAKGAGDVVGGLVFDDAATAEARVLKEFDEFQKRSAVQRYAQQLRAQAQAENVANANSNVVAASDPNDILGPLGFGNNRFITGTDPLEYTVRFENIATATAPAREIVVTANLDDDLNFDSFEFGTITLGGRTITVPAGRQFFETRIDATDLGILIDVRAEFDSTTGDITWRLRAVDPLTFDLPNDATVGLLPPNTTPGVGEGSLQYRVRLKSELATNTRIDAEADIIFDTNEVIPTPPIFNTFDRDQPIVTVNTLPAISRGSVQLSWNGTDVGSGIVSYTIFVSENGGPFSTVGEPTTKTSFGFVGKAGSTYEFKVQAIDGVGLLGESAGDSIAKTTFRVSSNLVGVSEFLVGTQNGAVKSYDSTGKVLASITVFPDFTGTVRTATADFNNDGIADLVVGTGPGRSTSVRILDGKSQAELFAIDPFEATFTGGVYVAVGDINGDGRPELVITPDEGGGPRVRVLSGIDFGVMADFLGIDDPNFRGGARASVGDLNGDGKGDLVVVAGFGGGPRVAGFDGSRLGATGGPKLFGDFFAFEASLRNGIFVTVGDLNGDGQADLIAGGGPGGGPRVLAFDGANLLQNQYVNLANFFGGNSDNRGGIRLAVKDLDGDNRADLVVGSGAGAGSRVTSYIGKNIGPNGTPTSDFDFDALDSFTGGVFVG